jgi:predicted amidohydrolase YtcJ
MPSADVIIRNARIFTSDESNPHAEAVAVKGNRSVYVGTGICREHMGQHDLGYSELEI